MHWQADSYPLYHQLSPCTFFNKDEATSRQHNHPSPQFTLPFTLWVREKYNDVQAFQVAPVVKNLPANAGDIRDVGEILGLGRSPGGGHDNHSSTFASSEPQNIMAEAFGALGSVLILNLRTWNLP